MSEPTTAETTTLKLSDRSVFLTHPLPMWVYDTRTLRVRIANEAAVRQYGWSAQEFQGLSVLDLRPREDAELLARLLMDDQREHRQVVARHIRRDGTLMSVRVFSHRLPGATGARLVTAVDITAERDAQHALHESYNLLRTITDSVPDAIFVKDLEGRYEFANEAAARIPGRRPSEMIGRTTAEVFGAAIARVLTGDERKVLDEGCTNVQEDSIVLHGRSLNFHTVEVPRRDADGRITGIIGVARDVTAQKQAEAAVRELTQRLQIVLRQAPAVLWTTDGELNVNWTDGAAYQHLSMRQEDVVGRCLLHWFDEESAPVRSHRAALAGRSGTYEASFEDRLYQVHVDPLRDGEGEIIGVVALGIDITDAKAAERALREQEAQLRHSQKMEAVGRLAGGVAHDFNNVLTAITGHTQLLLDRVDARDPIADDLREIQRAAERAAALTHQLLAFSRRQVLQPIVIGLHGVALEMKTLLMRLIGEDIELNTDSLCNGCYTRADRGQIEQVIMNLAVNARDAMPNGGMLTIATDCVRLQTQVAGISDTIPAGEYARLIVSDTGEGIAPEHLQHIFEPFFTTKERGRGTGLGLSTVFGIVKQSGGYVQVETAPERGTSFTILLPRVYELPTETKLSAPQEAEGTETILLVEDEPGVRRLAERVLRRKGYRVLSAQNGGEAILLAESHAGEIHALLTDVVMPNLGGEKLADMIQARRPGTKILFMSGYTEEAIERHLADGSARGFIQKPFTPHALASRVREMLDL